MKIVTIIGARPQFIKAATVSHAFKAYPHLNEIIIHTGQHFDKNMSDIFFEEMQIPEPKYNLAINSTSHGAMTGRMLEKIEEVLVSEKPDLVVVYGDTNSTLAGALAAKKLHIKIAHIEAGLRSFNNFMPEEINRILTDRISDFLFCPTDVSVNNLKNEGYDNLQCEIYRTGDVMFDAAIRFSSFAKTLPYQIPKKFILATLHRAENTNDINRLADLFAAFSDISKTIDIIMPLHPRTAKIIEQNNISISNIKITEPVGYLEIITLIKNCSLVMTDSGGMQKEAFFFKKPCITLRAETEWTELVNHGFNSLIGDNTENLYQTVIRMLNSEMNFDIDLYGNGKSSTSIAQIISEI